MKRTRFLHSYQPYFSNLFHRRHFSDIWELWFQVWLGHPVVSNPAPVTFWSQYISFIFIREACKDRVVLEALFSCLLPSFVLSYYFVAIIRPTDKWLIPLSTLWPLCKVDFFCFIFLPTFFSVYQEVLYTFAKF